MDPVMVTGSRVRVAIKMFCCVGISGDGSLISGALTEVSFQFIVTVQLPQDQILRQDLHCEILLETDVGINTRRGVERSRMRLREKLNYGMITIEATANATVSFRTCRGF